MFLENDTLTVTKAELSALLAFASKDTTRPHLMGLIVDPSSGRVSASDGHRILSWAPSEPTPIAVRSSEGIRTEPFTLGRAALEKAAKLAKKPEDTIALRFGSLGAVAKVTYSGKGFGSGVVELPSIVPYVADQAPRVEYSIPDYTETTGSGLTPFDFEVLAPLALAQKAIGQGVAIQYGPGRLDTALVRFRDPQWSGALAPLNMTRCGGSGAPLVGWNAPRAVVMSSAEPAPTSERAPSVAPAPAEQHAAKPATRPRRLAKARPASPLAPVDVDFSAARARRRASLAASA